MAIEIVALEENKIWSLTDLSAGKQRQCLDYLETFSVIASNDAHEVSVLKEFLNS